MRWRYFALPALTWLCAGLVPHHELPAQSAQSAVATQIPNWTTSTEPVLRIGSDARDETIFGGATVTRLASGKIVVVDQSTCEIRVFSATGAFERSLSRKGSGPNEFSARFFSVAVAADTILILEHVPGVAQVHAFAADGGFVRTPLRDGVSPMRELSPIARLSDGAYLVSPAGGLTAIKPLAPGSVREERARISLFITGEAPRRTSLGEFPSIRLVGVRSRFTPDQPMIVSSPYGGELLYAAAGPRAWIANALSGDVRVFNADGSVWATFRVPITPRKFDAAKLDAARDRAISQARSKMFEERATASYDPANLPPTAPLFTQMVAGINGEVWLLLFDEDVSAPPRFLVLDARGNAVAQVALPRHVRLHHVGINSVLGVEKDADGVETVVEYRLTRGTAARPARDDRRPPARLQPA